MSGPTPDHDHLRIGNADRERVVRQLNDAFAEGRLDVHELDERVAAAYAAKTFADLRPLTADLPLGTPPAPRWPGEPSRPPAPAQAADVAPRAAGRPPAAYRPFLGIFAINVVIWGVVSLANGHLTYFWPVWLLIPLGIAAVAHVVGGGTRGAERRHQQRWERRARRRGY
jgi:Domain of unknown function (DUF1707)